MASHLVSIIIPCYNAERWLAATLESAFAQTWQPIEVILIDDGSSDGSIGVARSYASKGLIIVEQSNRGAAAARNAGLERARGRFVQFLDADDLLAPEKIERQVASLYEHGDGVLVSGPWGRFSDDSSRATFTPGSNWCDCSGVEFLRRHWEDGGMMAPVAWLAPRSLLDRAGPWNETLSLNDDGEYFARVMLAAERIVFCADARSFYRSNIAGSLSGRKDDRALESLYRSIQLITQRLAETDSSARTRAAIARAWMLTAYETYPGRPDLSRDAERRATAIGASRGPLPGGNRFQLASRLIGWRWAKRLFS